jgi:hypothetical protein
MSSGTHAPNGWRSQASTMDANTLPDYRPYRPALGTRLPQATVAIAVLTLLVALPSIGFGVWLLDDTKSAPSTEGFARLGYFFAAMFAIPASISVVLVGCGWWMCRRVPRTAFALAMGGLICALLPLWVLVGILA